MHIIHGDIKPKNLVIVETHNHFCIKLIDFGTVEKLDTNVSQMSVTASKAHTHFYASPEFLKRDANRRSSRRLHKKSDAWAAGIMFYYLLLHHFPWEDQFEYQNFIDDPNSTDIDLAEIGEYQEIIELLLRKDPEMRASAEDTLKRLKKHALFGAIVESLEQKFYSIDDVCEITISDSTRHELNRTKPIKLHQKGQYS